jgi:uncharacterized protein (TIGR02391 family)
MDRISKSLLEELARASLPNLMGINAANFRARHPKYLDRLNKLEWDRYLEKSGENYRLSLIGLSEILNSVDEIHFLRQRFEKLFRVLKQQYEEHLNDNVSLNELSKASDLTREEVNVALTFMVEAHIFGTWTTDLRTEDATIAPSEDILRHRSFSEVQDKLRAARSRHIQKARPIRATIDGPNNDIADFQFLLHPTIIEHALPQYKNGYLRDAVFNSIVAVFDMIRQKTGLRNLDGACLVDEALSLEHPCLVLSNLDTDTGQNDQKGFIQIFKGSFQGIRNPKAHSLSHDLTKLKAAQYLVFASLLAGRIDGARIKKRSRPKAPHC